MTLVDLVATRVELEVLVALDARAALETRAALAATRAAAAAEAITRPLTGRVETCADGRICVTWVVT